MTIPFLGQKIVTTRPREENPEKRRDDITT